MNNTIKFDVIHGRCAACDAPVYFTRAIDWDGNRVNTLHCWNGHYEMIEIDHLMFDRDAVLTPEQIEEILPLVGFVRVNGDADAGKKGGASGSAGR